MHNYVKSLATEIKDRLKEKGYTVTEIALFDVMAKLLEKEYDRVDWRSTKSVNTFVELILNVNEDLHDNKEVVAPSRNLPKVKKKC